MLGQLGSYRITGQLGTLTLKLSQQIWVSVCFTDEASNASGTEMVCSTGGTSQIVLRAGRSSVVGTTLPSALSPSCMLQTISSWLIARALEL